jgi:putative ABC transport system permease protein
MGLFEYDTWQEIGATMRKNKLRTVLTAWGVFWGIFLLVVALGFAIGLENLAMQKQGGSAFNALYVWARRTTKPHAGFRAGRRIELRNSDIDQLRGLEGLEYLAPRLQDGGFRSGTTVTYADKVGNYEIMGDFPQFEFIQPMLFDAGRFINHNDIEERRKVCVIGTTVYQQLFKPGTDPVGEIIKIRGVAFQIVGLFRSRATGDQAERQGSTIFVPFTTFQQAFNARDRVNWFAMTAVPSVDPAVLEARTKELLARAHKVAPDDANAFGSFNAGEQFRKIQTLFGGIRLMMWLVGITTLFFGALGVSNIMLIAIKERTKEIGIRKALGARPRQIVAMVMTESIFLTTLAGYFGLVSAIGAIELIGKLTAGTDFPTPQADVGTALLAFAALVVAGAIAGIIPARHAAQISPIEALRAE